MKKYDDRQDKLIWGDVNQKRVVLREDSKESKKMLLFYDTYYIVPEIFRAAP